jgi:hypothetical protein
MVELVVIFGVPIVGSLAIIGFLLWLAKRGKPLSALTIVGISIVIVGFLGLTVVRPYVSIDSSLTTAGFPPETD